MKQKKLLSTLFASALTLSMLTGYGTMPVFATNTEAAEITEATDETDAADSDTVTDADNQTADSDSATDEDNRKKRRQDRSSGRWRSC